MAHLIKKMEQLRDQKYMSDLNKSRYLRSLREQGDIDYCLARLLHYGFYFTFEAKYFFQQSLEKYLKAWALKKSTRNFQDVDAIETYFKKNFGHKLLNLWEACRKKYPKSNIFLEKRKADFLKREFDEQLVSERARYPQKQFGGHPVSFTEEYISTVDEIIYYLCGLGSKRRICPLNITEDKCNFWCEVFNFDRKPKKWNREILARTFYYENKFFEFRSD